MSHPPKIAPPAALLPSHRKASRASSYGWAGSTAVSALLVSAIGALALSLKEPGSSFGETPVEIMMMMPEVPALEALSEPTPDVVDQQAAQEVQSEEIEETPDTPELTEAPEVPEDAPQVEDVALDDVPEIDTKAPPSPIVEKPKVEKKAEPVKEKPKKVAQDKPKKEKPKKKKSSDAAAETKASKATASASSAGAGNAAAAASYESQVMKKIMRTRKKTGSEKGFVKIAFSISGSGALAGVSVKVSSGSAKLDQIALNHIQRAAPFPPPPPGAKQNFTFNFKSE